MSQGELSIGMERGLMPHLISRHAISKATLLRKLYSKMDNYGKWKRRTLLLNKILIPRLDLRQAPLSHDPTAFKNRRSMTQGCHDGQS
jgi:hypothetical protein